jgi:hypothetical protein
MFCGAMMATGWNIVGDQVSVGAVEMIEIGD